MMPSTTLRRLTPLWCAIGLAVSVIGPATAQQPVDELADEQFAYEAADTDGNGYVSEGELARDAAVGFSSLDKDRSKTLTPKELAAHDPAQFAKVDSNHDGVLTFIEVMTNKTKAFAQGDKNRDGLLSFDEMVAAVKAEQGAPK